MLISQAMSAKQVIHMSHAPQATHCFIVVAELLSRTGDRGVGGWEEGGVGGEEVERGAGGKTERGGGERRRGGGEEGEGEEGRGGEHVETTVCRCVCV